MLKWYEENGNHLGFDDDTLLYIVDHDEVEGWRWLDIFGGWCTYDYANAEEAKAGAESDSERFPKVLTEDDESFLTPEELEEILGDMLYQERIDARMYE